MVRRLILTATLAATAGVYVLAQSVPATFILTDGSRKQGTMGFYGDKKENLIDGYLGLDTSIGRERFKLEQVAAVDFTGGQPPANEVSALPNDNNAHVIVLKDGASQKGRLTGLVAGNVQWQNEAGQAQQYAISDVQRIYLNPGSARMAISNTASTGAVATTGSSAVPGAIQVPANQACTDTGLTVKKGDHVSFQATGQISFAQGQTASPDGNADVKNPNYPVPVAGVGALIGRVNNSAAFPIGSNTQPITMPADGRLRLCINDDILTDNTGAFSVVVRKQ